MHYQFQRWEQRWQETRIQARISGGGRGEANTKGSNQQVVRGTQQTNQKKHGGTASSKNGVRR